MTSSSDLSQEHDGITTGIRRRSSSLELDVFPPRPSADANGKGRYVDGQETVEEDADDTSDAEAEGLLHKGKFNVEDGTIAPQSSEPRRPKALGGGRSTPAKTWMGRTFGDMSRAQRKLFAREMLVEVTLLLLGARTRCNC